jgi:hypothetical protein
MRVITGQKPSISVAQSEENAKRTARHQESPLGNDELLAPIFQAVGKREHVFVAAVSSRWSSRYLLKDFEYSRDTSYKSVLATASTLQCIVCRPHSGAPADLVQDVGARHLQLFRAYSCAAGSTRTRAEVVLGAVR